MKLIYAIIPLLVLALLLFGCISRRGGGTGRPYDYSNRWAKKIIKSKEIKSFEYEFSISGLGSWKEKGLRYSYCYFSLVRDGEEAVCKGWVGWHSQTEFEFDFRTSLSALDKLQEIIDTHEIAKVNGTNKGSEGIPAHIGSRLIVGYASGESIFAANNKGSILPESANIDIHDFFMELVGDDADSPNQSAEKSWNY